MTDHSEEIAHILLKQQIEEFLYQEAELLDERRYEDWLALLADDPDRGALGRGAALAHLPYDLQHSPPAGAALGGGARRGHRQMPLPDLPQPGGNGDRPPGGEAGGRPAPGQRPVENRPAEDRPGPERLAG